MGHIYTPHTKIAYHKNEEAWNERLEQVVLKTSAEMRTRIAILLSDKINLQPKR